MLGPLLCLRQATAGDKQRTTMNTPLHYLASDIQIGLRLYYNKHNANIGVGYTHGGYPCVREVTDDAENGVVIAGGFDKSNEIPPVIMNIIEAQKALQDALNSLHDVLDEREQLSIESDPD